MNTSLTNRNLAVVNFTIVFYFIALWLVNLYSIDFVLIEIFRELLTIPFLIAQIVFLVIGIKHITKNKKDSLIVMSVLTLATCAIITVGSFFL